MNFTKMHGLGNDYVVINCFKENIINPSKLAIDMGNRHFGIGSDGLLLISRSLVADCKMTMYNPDGTEGEMCGNGIRCVAKFAYEKGITNKKDMNIETKSGIKNVKLHIKGSIVEEVEVNMGTPILTPKEIPICNDITDIKNIPVNIDEKTYNVTAISMGNPHGVVFVDDIYSIDIEKIGQLLENSVLFPKKANIEFAHCIERNGIEARVWERGVGETLACGTGACAILVASVLNGYTDLKANIKLAGGDLTVEWKDKKEVILAGRANFVFEGNWNLE